MTEVVHRCPLAGTGVTPCCGRTPFELPAADRLTLDPARVTCREAEDEAVRAELGECTAAGDHEVVDGTCRFCGAEFWDEEDG